MDLPALSLSHSGAAISAQSNSDKDPASDADKTPDQTPTKPKQEKKEREPAEKEPSKNTNTTTKCTNYCLGFHKAVTVSDKTVIKALKKIYNNKIDDRCIGVFLLKDANSDTDYVDSLDQVHDVGVYARIGEMFDTNNGEDATIILYPTHRIRMGDLLPKAEPIEEESSESTDVTSFESEEVTIDKATAQEEYYKIPVSWATRLTDLEDLPYDPQDSMVAALTGEILNVLKTLSQMNRALKEQVVNIVLAGNKFTTSNVYEEPHILADFAASISAGRSEEIQDVLSSLDIQDRLQKALILVKRELENIKLQEKVSQDVEARIQKRQKEYYLMEQMKGIKRELGMDDGRDKIIQTFKDRAEKLALPEAAEKVFNDELQKLSSLEPNAAEYNVTRQYLDWITQLPWGKFTKDSYNLAKAIKILDHDHHGLKDVKDRILEFIAVGKLLGAVDGKIICFVGPPGVGKTSVAKSIAKSLNREFYRFSIGGVSDVSELKGHRRTYVGALPGRIIQALKKTQTQNPLILIDEIDKIGRGAYHGDPSAALLELLDPEQNNSFLDHYLDIPVDMSKTLFVCTANTLETIPGPLLDRMEIIEISGYVAEEKIAIAEQYLAPSAKKLAGLEEVDVQLSHDAIERLINQYCRESGVRNLKKQIEKIYRKAALNIIKNLGEEEDPNEIVEVNKAEVKTKPKTDEESSQAKTTESTESNSVKSEEPAEEAKVKLVEVPKDVSVSITANDLKDYVGPPVFTEDRMYEKTPIGVTMGLGVSSMGGSALYVESVLEQPLTIQSHPGLNRTGQLGDTMKESSNIAYSFVRMFLGREFPENRFFERAKIHLHCPEGATPKDGPSAGITMATSLLSLALNHAISPTIAMTGELTLTGKVLRIGGLREKAVAAKRAGAKTIFFPRDNLADWESMPDNVKEGLEPVPVGWYADVYERAFADLDRRVAGELWKEQFLKIDEEKAKRDGA
ncbi:hypothetical protein DV495_003937 [Geotrichum candidum]|nr:hypothetical protein DV454_003756 [Geotrichum candidum]KAI9210178.1 hypothetical protein DS838_004942 [Geotrichum bryndzae]KAF5119852.1 hypothetical protein DV452_001427 [Geotrichum candidum]KAF5124514.1 hypothetical protein DV495_003937 [Geotrichum candidum]KAF7497678.1 hypothetical protein DV113_004304 [Geotrichum candidum]